jgi:hypothetical protein
MRPLFLRHFFKEARQGVAALCLLILLAVQAMAVFPSLHALVHNDSTDPSHRCAVTMLLHGQVHATGGAVEVIRNAPIFFARPLATSAVFVSADVRLLPSRGPPVLPAVI